MDYYLLTISLIVLIQEITNKRQKMYCCIFLFKQKLEKIKKSISLNGAYHSTKPAHSATVLSKNNGHSCIYMHFPIASEFHSRPL